MTRRLTRAGLLLALGLTWPPAAASAQNRTDMQLMADMRMLHEELQQTRLLINTLAEQIRATNARLDALERSVTKSFADQKLDIDAMTTSVARLSDKVSENSVRVGQFASEMSSIRQGIGLSNTMLDQILKLITPPPSPDLAAIDPTAPPPNPATLPPLTQRPAQPGPGATPASPIAQYNQATNLYWAGNFPLAIEALRQFVTAFPADPNAPRALENLARSHYQLGQFQPAMAAYAEIVAKYPQSDRVPEALYGQGLCHEQLKQNADAKRFYTQVIQEHPDSSAALQAKQRLQRVGGGATS